MKELLIRVGVAIIGIPLLVFLVWQGGLWFLAFILLVAALGQWEMYHMLEQKQVVPQKTAGIFSGLSVIVLTYTGFSGEVFSLLLALLVFIFASEMFYNRGSSNLNIGGTLLGVIYPVLFLDALLFLRINMGGMFGDTGGHASAIFILTLFVAIWTCDTMAYFVGVRFGKHRLFERVSPKKSIEGALGGLAGAMLVFLLVWWRQFIPLSLPLALSAGFIVGVFGQLGDLVESWFKRDAGVKDSSKILPGHGGILDRFDSLMFVSPIFMILYFLWI